MRLLFPTLTAVLTIVMVQPSSSADSYHQSASECRTAQYSAVSADFTNFTPEGAIYNAWSVAPLQPLFVVCPIRWYGTAGTISPATFTIGYVDREPTQTLACSLFAQDSVGNIWVGSGKHSCGTAGGCGSASSTYYTTTGIDTLQIPGFCSPGGLCPVLSSFTMGCSIPWRTGSLSGNPYSYLYDIVTTL